MFKGFNVSYPEYEVITPQTKLSFNVRSLTVQEEEKLKGSLLTPAKINEHLNQCLYAAITQKPSEIKDYNNFLKKVTLKDRDALLYGLYHITYEEIRNYDVTCGSCRRDYAVTVQASSTFSMNQYPGKDILEKEIDVSLPVTKGVHAIVKQPSLYDEMIAYKTYGSNVGTDIDLLTETLIIKRFQQTPEEGDSIVYSDREDIIDAYRTLAARDKREVYKKYREAFGQYGIVLKMRSNCSHCGNEEEIDIDLVENFFRMVYSV